MDRNVRLVAFGLLTSALTACGTSSSSSSLTVKGSATAITSFAALTTAGHGSPTKLQLDLFAIYVSQNADCTGAVLAGGDETTAVTKDMFESPTLFSGNPANGTYPCVILKMKDVMTFRSDTTGIDGTNAGCTSTTTDYQFDIHRTGDTAWKAPDGTSIAGNGDAGATVADTVYIYASTNPTAVESGTIGADSSQVVTLTSPLVVPSTVTLHVDSTDAVANHNNGSSDFCWLEKATFGFK